MTDHFFIRLRRYYSDVAAVLRGEAKAASIFPNSSDVGISRERLYAEFLRQHAPTKCNVFFGGFLFGEDGTESKQLDVIVTSDITPRFDLHNKDGNGKSFAPVDGAIGAVCIKSTLNKKELEDSLLNIAAVPAMPSLEGRVVVGVSITNYDDWPYKIIYASDGISEDTLLQHITDFYERNSGIPTSRRPNLIHVSGKYVIFRVVRGMTIWDHAKGSEVPIREGSFRVSTRDPDLQGLSWTVDALQQRASASAHIKFSYDSLFKAVLGVSPK